MNKLVALLGTRKLSFKFNAIIFITAHDPEVEIRSIVRSLSLQNRNQLMTDPD
jgi:hypothetical protein